MAKLITLEGETMQRRRYKNPSNRCYRGARRKLKTLAGESNPMEDFIVGDSLDEIEFGDSLDEITFGEEIEEMISEGYSPDGRNGQYVQNMDGTLGYIDPDGDEWIMDGFGSWIKKKAKKAVKKVGRVGSKVVRSKAFKNVAKVVAEGVSRAYGAPPGAGSRAVNMAWKSGDALSKVAHKAGRLVKPRKRKKPRARVTPPRRYSAVPSNWKSRIRSRLSQLPRIGKSNTLKFAIPIGIALAFGGFYLLTRKK